MKRLLKIVLAAVLAVSGAVAFVGCTETKYNIKYTIDGVVTEGTPNSYTMSLNDPIALWSPEEREDFIFDGWYEDADFTTVKSTAIASRVKGDKEYFGRYIKNTYEITYVLDGIPTKKEYTVSSSANALWSPTPPGELVLDGWYENADLTGARIAQLPPNTIGDKQFYGAYVDPATLVLYDIEYYLSGVLQTEVTPKTYKKSESATQLWDPTDLDKHVLDGWYLNADFSGDKVTEIPGNSEGSKKYYGKLKEPNGWGNNKTKVDFTLPEFSKKVGDQTITSPGATIANFYGIKPVFIGFWGARCDKCKHNMDVYYESLYAEYKDTIEFIMIQTGEPVEYVKDYMGGYNYSFPYYIDRNATVYYSLFEGSAGTINVPRTIFVDKWGYETGRYAGKIETKENETEFMARFDGAINPKKST